MIVLSKIHGAPRVRRINTVEGWRESQITRMRAQRRDRYIQALIERGRDADESRRRHLKLLIMALGYGASLPKASAAVGAALCGDKNMTDLGPFKVEW